MAQFIKDFDPIIVELGDCTQTIKSNLDNQYLWVSLYDDYLGDRLKSVMCLDKEAMIALKKVIENALGELKA